MTTHRMNEAITFVSWQYPGGTGPLHIRRPRSQTGLAYCGTLAKGSTIVARSFTIAHPDEIPLEIRIERDFANLCPKCARMFFNEVAEENALLRWSGVLVSVPIAWQAIYTRTGRTITDAQAATERLAREARLDLQIEDREEAGL